MADAVPKHEAWKFRQPIGELLAGALAADVDVGNPQLGFHGFRLRSQPLNGTLLAAVANNAAAWPVKLAEAYVRGDDLVASYSPSADWPYAPQIYWSSESGDRDSGVLAAVSLLVSIQTSLLDTHPVVSVHSELLAGEVFSVGCPTGDARALDLAGGKRVTRAESSSHGLLWRLPGDEFSYAEFASSTDFRELGVEKTHDGNIRSGWQLFAEFLEKGVIRRARIHAAILPRADDLELATGLCRSLDSRPLPLTT
jgi:hypothetical protein